MCSLSREGCVLRPASCACPPQPSLQRDTFAQGSAPAWSCPDSRTCHSRGLGGDRRVRGHLGQVCKTAKGSLHVGTPVSQALSAAHISLSKSHILKNSDPRCPLMSVAVLSGTARVRLSPRGLQRVRKPTLCSPSPPWSTTQPAGGTAPCCGTGGLGAYAGVRAHPKGCTHAVRVHFSHGGRVQGGLTLGELGSGRGVTRAWV